MSFPFSSQIHQLAPLSRLALQLLLLAGVLVLIQRNWPFAHMTATNRPAGRKGNLLRACLVPAVFLGFGLATFQAHGWYSSYQAYHDIQGPFARFRTPVDNYVQFLPFAEVLVFTWLGVPGLSNWRNRFLLLLKSEVLLVTMVFALKYATNVDRPNGDYFTFPSGHTAEAFLAASIVHQEFRHRSPWYGIGAYGIAAIVGLMRLFNNKHWEADVFAGAGIGILAAHLAYFFHLRMPARRANEQAELSR